MNMASIRIFKRNKLQIMRQAQPSPSGPATIFFGGALVQFWRRYITHEVLVTGSHLSRLTDPAAVIFSVSVTS
jgi:hypothetical protein